MRSKKQTEEWAEIDMNEPKAPPPAPVGEGTPPPPQPTAETPQRQPTLRIVDDKNAPTIELSAFKKSKDFALGDTFLQEHFTEEAVSQHLLPLQRRPNELAADLAARRQRQLLTEVDQRLRQEASFPPDDWVRNILDANTHIPPRQLSKVIEAKLLTLDVEERARAEGTVREMFAGSPQSKVLTEVGELEAYDQAEAPYMSYYGEGKEMAPEAKLDQVAFRLFEDTLSDVVDPTLPILFTNNKRYPGVHTLITDVTAQLANQGEPSSYRNIRRALSERFRNASSAQDRFLIRETFWAVRGAQYENMRIALQQVQRNVIGAPQGRATLHGNFLNPTAEQMATILSEIDTSKSGLEELINTYEGFAKTEKGREHEREDIRANLDNLVTNPFDLALKWQERMERAVVEPFKPKEPPIITGKRFKEGPQGEEKPEAERGGSSLEQGSYYFGPDLFRWPDGTPKKLVDIVGLGPKASNVPTTDLFPPRSPDLVSSAQATMTEAPSRVEGEQALRMIHDAFKKSPHIYFVFAGAIGDVAITSAYLQGIREYTQALGQEKRITIIAPENVVPLIAPLSKELNYDIAATKRYEGVSKAQSLIEEKDERDALVFEFEHHTGRPVVDVLPNGNVVVKDLFASSIGLYDNTQYPSGERFSEFFSELLSIPVNERRTIKPHIELPENADQIYEALKQQYRIDTSKRQIAVIIEGSHPMKRYVLTNWQTALEQIAREQPNTEFNILYNPAPGTASYTTQELEAVFSQVPNARLMSTNLTESMVLLAEQDLVLSNDTGLAHVAAVVENGPNVISLHIPAFPPNIWLTNLSRHEGLLPAQEFLSGPFKSDEKEEAKKWINKIPPTELAEKALEVLRAQIPPPETNQLGKTENSAIGELIEQGRSLLEQRISQEPLYAKFESLLQGRRSIHGTSDEAESIIVNPDVHNVTQDTVDGRQVLIVPPNVHELYKQAAVVDYVEDTIRKRKLGIAEESTDAFESNVQELRRFTQGAPAATES